MKANTIIAGALRRLLVTPIGGTPSAAQYSAGLEVLNDMVNSWSAQNDLVYEDTLEELTIPSGTQSITIGATGTLVTARPLKITVATLKDGTNEYPMSMMDEQQYSRFYDKTVTSQPYRLYYRNTWPNGTIYFEYTTDQEYTLILSSIKQLSTFPDGTTEVSLPDHYERALKANLAVEMADEYGASLTAGMIAIAQESRNAIIGQAVSTVPAQIEISSTSNYNINSDSY